MMEGDVRVVELFAGVGGFRVGLQNASSRFVTIWANQWEPGRKDQFAFDCYCRNFPDECTIKVNADIALVKGEVPEEFDLLVGGFPCQDYSVAATNAKGIEGKKGVLWWHIRDIVDARRPRYVLLENVDRLLKSPASKRGRDFGIILRSMYDLGYSVEWRVINAADYGFVQRRRRVFIFASRNDSRHYAALAEGNPETRLLKDGFFSKEFPIKQDIVRSKMNSFDISREEYGGAVHDNTEGRSKALVAVTDGFAEQFYNAGVMAGSEVYTREVQPDYSGACHYLESILEHDVPESYYQDECIDKWREMKGSKRIERVNKRTGVGYVYSEGSIPFPDPINRPGRTMLTSEGSKNRSSHLICDPDTGRYRTLTPMECERMNGFEAGWTKGMTDRQRYFTMGNALVVGLVEKMGKEIIRLYDRDCESR